MATKRLQDRVALVTGADTAIGQASAIEMAKQGANVVLAFAQTGSGIDYTQSQVELLGGSCLAIQIEQEEHQIQQMFDAGIEAFNGIDVLMNSTPCGSAGILLEELSTDQWQNTFTANTTQVFLCCRQFIRHRKSVGGNGRIINVTSQEEDPPRPLSTDTQIIRAAVETLTRNLAIEVAPYGIAVNNLTSSLVTHPHYENRMLRSRELDEVGRLAAFLASDDASYVTGSTYLAPSPG